MIPLSKNVLANVLFLIIFAIIIQIASSKEEENGPKKPIMPSAILEAGRILAAPEIVERTHGFGQAIDGFSSKLNSSKFINKIGEKTMEKLRELKSILPTKFQVLMEKAIQIFKEPAASEKEQWDKLIKSVESTTKLSQEEKREFYEKLAAVTIQMIN